MRGINRRLLAVGLALLVLAGAIALSAQVLAATEQAAQGWRSSAQKQVREAFVTFAWMGVLSVATLAVGVGGLAIQMWTRVTFPQRTATVLGVLEGKRWKLFLVGLVNLVFLWAVFLVCIRVSWLRWLACIVGILLLALVFLGLLGRSERLGTKILTAAGRAPNPIAGILVGWPVLYFVVIIPFLGWALLFYLVVTGTGAAILSFLSERNTPSGEEDAQPS